MPWKTWNKMNERLKKGEMKTASGKQQEKELEVKDKRENMNVKTGI